MENKKNMKKIEKVIKGSLPMILLFSVVILSGYVADVYKAKKQTAEVEQLQGVYIFTNSKPVLEYDFLGSIKVGVAMSADYQTIRNKLMKKARKDYPRADGLIFYFNKGQADRCDAIKFK